MNDRPIAIALFGAFISLSLAITWWAARRTHSRREFYSAGGELRGFQNGLAIAGDYTSAATFLGVTGLVYSSGFDGLIYAIGFLMAWPLILFLIAEPLRNLGRYTFADVTSYRLSALPMRGFATISTLVIVTCYLITQMVAAGNLVQTLFGITYPLAVLLVGVLMTLYVAFGGMLATTWVQIIKAVLLLSGTILMVALICSRFGFNLNSLIRTAVVLHPKHAAILAPGGFIKDPWSAFSLGIALIFGTAGLPHILMRFFTVPNARQARNSVLVATSFIALFYTLLFILGFGAIAVLGSDPGARDALQKAGSNMVALYLANVLGGPVLFGFISAVAFSTILAVVSGLTIAGASAVSHDLYASILRRGKAKDHEEMVVSKLAVCALGAVSVALGLLFEHQNIAYMVGLTFAVSASANFPVILMSLAWKGTTSRGAVSGGVVGLISSVGLVILSPGVWTSVLGLAHAPFPLENPAIISCPAALLTIWITSALDQSRTAEKERAAFAGQFIQGELGINP